MHKEAEIIVRELRNHASLVAWCGDNEVDMTYVADGLSPQQNRITREILPQVVHRLDPHRDYIPSSPYISPEAFKIQAISHATPEQNLWGPRGYYKSSFYGIHSAHFIGEIGYHGCPQVSSIKKFISSASMWPWQDNEEWQAHSVYHWQNKVTECDRIKLMANQVFELFGETPDHLNDFVLASQICQAEAKKFFIESTRYRKWATSGILWWNLIDGWPQFSDAVVDYYFSKKLAYYYIQRSQQAFCIFMGEPGIGKYLPVIASKNSNQSWAVVFSIQDAEPENIISGGSCHVPSNQNWQVDSIRTYASEQRLYLIQWTAEGKDYGNHYLVGSPPLNLICYQSWLPKIAKLPQPFDVNEYNVG